MTKITCLRTWATNMGNVFIDLGSIQSLRMAAPESTIYQVSGLSRILFENRYYGWSKNILHRIFRAYPNLGMKIMGRRWRELQIKVENRMLDSRKSLKNIFDLGLFMKADFVVIAGCILDITHAIRLYGATLLKLSRENIKIILHGVGGASYSQAESEGVRKFLKKIKPYAFISRDEPTFERYNHLARYSYNGVDCAFFLSDFFQPAKLDLPKYTVLTFDMHPEPDLHLGNKLIVRTHHKFIGGIPKRYFDKPNTLISDLPEDYLNTYANAASVHSDRVHACVPAISFGTPCKLYFRTPRALLFNRIGLEGINEKLTCANEYELKKEKEKQVAFLSEILL